ncbi:MAG: preprotein translocase subunit SecG, partial [Nitrospirota bacterium]
QAGKGSDIGATFGGGGSQTLFGSRGAGNFLTKVTSVAGAIFMVTSLLLAMSSSTGNAKSIMEGNQPKKQMPARPAMPSAPNMPAQPGTAPSAPGTAFPASPAAPGHK